MLDMNQEIGKSYTDIKQSDIELYFHVLVNKSIIFRIEMEMGESVIMIFSIYVKNIYLIPLLIDYISQYNIYRFKIKNNLK